MRRLVKVQGALSQMVISSQWGIWKTLNSKRAQKVKALIWDDNWWARVQFVLDFTNPIMTMLRFSNTDQPCLGDVYDGMDTMVEKVASSSAAERNWSIYSFIHSVKRNQLGSKKAEDLVYIHTNLRLLSRKEDHYKEGAAKLWDVEPECANLDATIQDLTTIMDDDGDNIMTHGSSSTSGTILGSNDLELAAVGGVGDDEDIFANPYDSDLD